MCNLTPFTVRARSKRRLGVVFSPTKWVTRYEGTLTIVSNYSRNPETEVLLRGEAIHWLTAPDYVNFGDVPVNQDKEKEIKITNSSPFSCDISGVKTTGAFRLSEPSGGFPVTLPPNQSFTLGIFARPTKRGWQEGTLEINYNTTGGIAIEPLRVSLRVNGIDVPI